MTFKYKKEETVEEGLTRFLGILFKKYVNNVSIMNIKVNINVLKKRQCYAKAK